MSATSQIAAPTDRPAGVAALARPTWDINHVIAYGQSLAMGYEGWPALSLMQPHDSLMLGDSVRPAVETSPDWRPVGATAFQPLVATVQASGGEALLSPDRVAALPAGDIAAGETVLEAAVNGWRGQLLAAGAIAGRNRLLASTVGVGGRSIEALSRTATPPLFQRLRGCVGLARDTASAENLSYGVVALLFLQGEHNALAADGGTADRAKYRDLLETLHRDLLAEVAAVSGQTAPPGLFSYQTGGAYANATNSVAQAQLDFCIATPGCFMVGPSYPVTAKSGHLDANGYRWLGAQFGKVLNRVLTEGRDWLPLHPRHAVLVANQLRVRFIVPVAPLAWGQPFAGHGLAEPTDRGFAAYDENGPVPIEKLAFSGDDEVVLYLARTTVGTVTLQYADATVGGRGCLRDSDPTMAADMYVYDPATGHDPTADQPDLNGQPYPLHNWCAAFSIRVIKLVGTLGSGTDTPAGGVQPIWRGPAAWDTLRTTRTQVTGERVPDRSGWFARLLRALLGPSRPD